MQCKLNLEEIMSIIYNKNNPFKASVIERYSLCSEHSTKSVVHVVLSLKGSNLTYRVGDSIAIYSENDSVIVKRLLDWFDASGNEVVLDRQQTSFSFQEFLMKKANLSDVPKKLLAAIGNKETDPEKKKRIEDLLLDENKESFKEFQKNHEVWDTLLEFTKGILAPQEFVSTLMPLLPRFYSIASSMIEVGDEVHLTVAELEYVTNNQIRRGVCTYYLCKF